MLAEIENMAEAEETNGKGIRCPRCGCGDLRVLYTRPGNDQRQRVRLCRNCKRRIVTYEKVIGTPPAG